MGGQEGELSERRFDLLDWPVLPIPNLPDARLDQLQRRQRLGCFLRLFGRHAELWVRPCHRTVFRGDDGFLFDC